MEINPFALERYLARHEFAVPIDLCGSACETVGLAELLEMADPECLALWRELRLGYTDTTGHPLLRRAAAACYHGLSADDIRIVAPEEGIFIAMHALLRPGDHVVATFPGYQSLYEIARSRGCRVSFWRPRTEPHWHFHPDDLEAEVREDTRMVVVNFPHNPSGFVPEAADFARVVRTARECGAVLFSDEMYRGLEFAAADRLPAAVDAAENAVTLCGLSKSYGLPGLRIGWLATRNPEWRERFAVWRDYTTVCSGAVDEILGLIALRAGGRLLERNRVILAENRAALLEFQQDMAGRLDFPPLKSGPITFPQLPEGRSAREFCDAVREREGVLLLPSTVYDYGDRRFRLGFGRRGFPQGLDRLRRFLAGWG